jgi:hypothetical protein
MHPTFRRWLRKADHMRLVIGMVWVLPTRRRASSAMRNTTCAVQSKSILLMPFSCAALASYVYRHFDPSTWCLLELLQVLERRRDFSKALGVFERALLLAPDNHMVQFRRIRVLVAMGRYQVSAMGF